MYPPRICARLRRLFVAGVLFGFGLHQPTQVGSAGQSATLEIPTACTTRTRIDDTPLDRAWVFVVNFRVPGAACMIIYDRTVPGTPAIAFRVLPSACEPVDDVDIRNGFAFFRGGYISCTVNIRTTVNDMLQVISPTATISESARHEGFYVATRAYISPTQAYTNALLFAYQPISTTFSPVSLRIVTSPTLPGKALLSAFFNGSLHSAPECVFALSRDQRLMAFTRYEGNLKFWALGTELCAASRPWPPIRLWHDGGTFFIGGRPDGGRFMGVVDEVILDPQGGTKPPNTLEGPLDSTIFMPLMTMTTTP
jgi:hypothetical protein